jgi:EAL domain-containing protein (putative c-di-GMP-specific phosphodiesterase class I)
VAPSKLPYLEHYSQKGRPPHRVLIQRLPFRIGRSQEADHTIYSPEVSTLHAEIAQVGEGFVLRDLGSTNGTFVNGERTMQRWLNDGDIVHIASEELRFSFTEPFDVHLSEATVASSGGNQARLIRETNDLQRIFAQNAVCAVFQPIVRLDGSARIAYETLGRVTLDEGRYTVGEGFRIATDRDEGARLSRLMREAALADLARIPEKPVSIFFNLHPSEMLEPEHLEAAFSGIARGMLADQRAVLEIHEGAVTDPNAMRMIRERLNAFGIGLAYDDFGAGQSRLMELVEVPPDVLKLDMSIVRDIDQSQKRQDLVRALVAVMRDLGIEVLAEGIERGEEATACQALGCSLGQGYFFGRPAPAGS